jgi:iron complex outermembrane receptor protein
MPKSFTTIASPKQAKRTQAVILLCLTSARGYAMEKTVELEPMMVTGSAIEQSDASGLLPVKSIEQDEIKKTGSRTVNDLLKYIPEIDFADVGTQNSLDRTAGASFIKLRGLPANNTLVLLDGHRLPNNPLQGNDGYGASVDINLIPLSAIERIEILKSSGSAIYGSDAIAGVVNLITKKDYRGVKLLSNYGISSHADGAEKQFGFTAGRGDLDRDRYNGLVVFEHFDRDPVYRADRDMTKTVDFRSFGGQDLRSANAPQGNIISGANKGSSLQPCPPEDLNGSLCRYNYNALPSTALTGMNRWNMLAQGTLKLNETTQWHNQFLYASKSLSLENQPTPDNFTLPSKQVIQGRFMQGGNRTIAEKNEMYQGVSKLNGKLYQQNWEISTSYAINNNNSQYRNYFLHEPLLQAIQNGVIDPTVMTNNQAIVNGLKITPSELSRTSLWFANGQLNGDLWRNDDFGLRYATGVQWRRETLENRPDDVFTTGQVASSTIKPYINAGRNTTSGFGELKLQYTDQVELQTALRYDNFGSADNLSPKVALAYTPSSRWTLRGNWGQSFLMPAFSQMYADGSSNPLIIQNNDCKLIGLPSNCVQPGFLLSGNNTALKPETARSWGFGLDAKPFSFANVSFDFWHIDKANEIVRPDYRMALQNGFYDISNNNLYIHTQNVNLTSTKLEGIDGGLDFNFSLGSWGKLSLADDLTYYLQYDVKRSPNSLVETRLGYANDVPQWRNQFAVTWAFGNWSSSVFVRSTAGFIDTFNYPTAASSTPANVRAVNSYTEADFVVGYKGIRHLDLSLGVKNFTNAQPPFSLSAGQRTFGFAYAPLYDNRGAFFFLAASYEFGAPD